MKKFKTPFFLLSEASGVLATSVYGLTVSFVFQKYIDSQFLNSLVNNVTIALSMLAAFFVGHFVDKRSSWQLILLSDLVLAPLYIIPIFLFHLSVPLFLVSVLVIELISTLLSELDAVSRPVYLSRIVDKKTSISVLQHINIIDSAFSIIGYLFVFLTISFMKWHYYFIIVGVFYFISLMFILNLPKEKQFEQQDKVVSHTFFDDLKLLIHIIREKKQILLYCANLIFMVKNQVIMSLLIFRIGQLDAGFAHIHIVGVSLLISVGIGALLNKILYSASTQLRKVLAIVLMGFSAYFTYRIGHVTFIDNFFIFGLMIGAIFGTGLPCFGLLSSERMLVTSGAQQGKSLSLLRTFSVLITILLTALFAMIEKFYHVSTIYFDGSMFLSLVLVFIFMVLEFKGLNKIDR